MNNSEPFLLDPSGLARLSGALTLDTVASIYQQAKTAATQGRQIAGIDLDAVSRVDSSGLALLLEWQSLASRDGRSLHISNAPADLLSLANLCEASDLLCIEGRNHSGAAPAKMQSGSIQDAIS
jgi:phospholipid transport system transporter-binding protein